MKGWPMLWGKIFILKILFLSLQLLFSPWLHPIMLSLPLFYTFYD
jgi:hypothetical protein